MLRTVVATAAIASFSCLVSHAEEAPKMTISLTSPAIENGKPIPKRYTADGDDVSPPLAWGDLPAGTRELVVICDDPDAPTPQPWVHWLIYKIPPDAKGLPEDVAIDERLDTPAGALQGKLSWRSGQTIGYRGPAPPPGKVHHYQFRVYALDKPLDVEPGLEKSALVEAMTGHILGEGLLVGTYQR
ncbi:MAG: YbhB/YbcL family Raf kinase inhibitor-like protein [Pirellulales bacterium]